MTDRQENKRSMYLSVRKVVNDFTAAWSGLPAFVNANGEFNSGLDELDMTRLIQESATEGVTQDKQQAKDEVVTMAIKVGSATYAYATVTENLTLQALVGYTKSELDKSRDTVLIDKLQIIYGAGNDNVANLADYGILPADITAFDGLIAAYVDQVQNPRVAIGDGAAATDHLVEVIEKIDGILKKKMDKLMEVLKNSNGEFYVKYRKARIIVDLGKGGAGDEPEPSPTSP
jgi:hypothetical protein